MITYIVLLTFACSNGQIVEQRKTYDSYNKALISYVFFKDRIQTMRDAQGCTLTSVRGGHRKRGL